MTDTEVQTEPIRVRVSILSLLFIARMIFPFPSAQIPWS